jgi:hypothetical protein
MARDKYSGSLRLAPGQREQSRKATENTLGDDVELSILELEERIMPGFHTP